MIEAITSRIESDYLLIVASGKIVTNEEYRLLLKRYCDEVLKSGLKKIIVDETNVDYAFSLLLQTDIVEFYSSGELPQEFSTWTFAEGAQKSPQHMQKPEGFIETVLTWIFKISVPGWVIIVLALMLATEIALNPECCKPGPYDSTK